MAGKRRYLIGLHGVIWDGAWDEHGPHFYPLRKQEDSAGNDTIAHLTPGLILTRCLRMREFFHHLDSSEINPEPLLDDRYKLISCSRFDHVRISD